MNHIFEFLFSQYKTYDTLDIVLELIAVVFTIASVWFSKRNNVLVFPTGMVSTAIFVYLLLKWDLLGDMIINAYYFIMSLYGWYVWTTKVSDSNVTPISETTIKEKWISLLLGIGALIFIALIYMTFNKFDSWTAYVDTFTTAIFFAGMWLMAKRKIENWLFWIVGNIITVPLYFYKGLTFSSLLYIVLTIIAIFGYKAWKKHLNNTLQTV
ncbi:nicotinamide riboside transporter PnuC [Psychroserpens sp. S379A]|uniref:nicotinamide riboside transporter PnuC n=1 Tax=Psychroserpens sp. S379A TaxID=3415137 RepID=UPI003C7C6C5F